MALLVSVLHTLAKAGAGRLVGVTGFAAGRRALPWGPATSRVRERCGPRGPSSLGLVMLRNYLDCRTRRLIETFLHALRDRIEDNLPAVGAPALVVRGARDPIVSQRCAELATEMLPRGRLVVVPGAAHALNYNAPLELARVVQAFLDGDRD